MDSIDYLSGDFVTERAQLDEVRRTANEARETLEQFADNGAWPYEVVQGELRAARLGSTSRNTSVISHSTSAMILFALGVISGRVHSWTLAPYVEPLSGKKGKEARKKFDSELRAFLKKIDSEPKGSDGNWHSHSGTYGMDDPFTLLWILEICRDLRGDVSRDLRTDTVARYVKALEIAERRVAAVFSDKKPWIASFEQLSSDKEPVEHAFPILRIVQIYDHLRYAKNASAAAKDPNKAPPAPSGTLPPYADLARYLHDRLHIHLSYSTIPDSSYDPAELAFTIEALLHLDEDSIDAATIARCREVLLDTQKKTSYWRPLRPFIVTQQGMVLLPLSVETGNSLVRSCEMLARREHSRADRSGDAALFKRYTEWLFGRVVRGEATNGRFMGWRSEHADDRGKIHLWETSQVLVYLLQYESFLRSYRGERGLRCLNLNVTYYPATRPKRRDLPLKKTPVDVWKDDMSGPVAGIPAYAVMSRIEERFIAPRSLGAPADAARSYSMLLYGPQGTGKTYVAEKIAESLGWPLISISPSDFMVSGDTLVEARAKQLFDVLRAQSEAVIIFDEIDRLILDRSSESYAKQSDPFQLMTPGMLTKLHDLRDEARTIFIISTNYFERIDSAIKRTGRIDKPYLVLPPDSAQRATFLDERLRKEGIADSMVPSATELDPVVGETVLFSYSELKKLVESLAATVAREPGATVSWKGAKIATMLKDLAEESPSSIQVAPYQRRFIAKKGETEPAPEQKPFEEWLMLMYLVAEAEMHARPVEEQERDVWRKIVDHEAANNAKTMDDVMQKLADDVRKLLLKTFQNGHHA